MTRKYDLARLKRAIPIGRLLAHYSLDRGLREQGAEWVGACPLPGHAGDRDNRSSFRVNPAKGVWRCLTHCGGGDLVRLAALLEGGDYAVAARMLALVETSGTAGVRQLRPGAHPPPAHTTFRPYTRRLGLDPHHPFLRSRGIHPETARTFEAGGWPLGGFLEGCIGVRLHDPSGKPLGYAGQRLAPHHVALHGKWKLPRGLPKSDLLFNWHRARPHAAQGMVVVEGPWDAMRVHQAGLPNVVALGGVTMSRSQRALLLDASPLVLMLDGDEAGRTASRALASSLHVPAQILELPHDHDPSDIPDERLREILSLLS